MVEENVRGLGLYNKNRLSPLRMDQVSTKDLVKEYFWRHYYTHNVPKMLHNTLISTIVYRASLFFDF